MEGDGWVADAEEFGGGFIVFRNWTRGRGRVSCQLTDIGTEWIGKEGVMLGQGIEDRESLHSGETPLGRAESAARMEVLRVRVLRSTSASTLLMAGGLE